MPISSVQDERRRCGLGRGTRTRMEAPGRGLIPRPRGSVMMPELAEQLRDWRAQRGLSLSGLAVCAGLAKATLSGWERGLHQPRLVELEALFTALDVPLPERQAAVALIDAPRARRALATPVVSASSDVVAQPVPGHLLQAMRRRRGLT